MVPCNEASSETNTSTNISNVRYILLVLGFARFSVNRRLHVHQQNDIDDHRFLDILPQPLFFGSLDLSVIAISILVRVLLLQVLTKNCHIVRGSAWLLTIHSLIVLNFRRRDLRLKFVQFRKGRYPRDQQREIFQ